MRRLLNCHRLRKYSSRHGHVRASSCGRNTQSTKAEGGYQSFGSFHSADVEELVRVPSEYYRAPELPFDVEEEGAIDEGAAPRSLPSSSAPFANSLRHVASYSRLDRSRWTFLNHGAFGLGLDAGLRRACSWRRFMESQPLRFFDRYLLDHLAHSARRMADFVTKDERHAQRMRESTALIPNVTSGMNAVIGGHARCGIGGGGMVFYYVSSHLLSRGRAVCVAHPLLAGELKLKHTNSRHSSRPGRWIRKQQENVPGIPRTKCHSNPLRGEFFTIAAKGWDHIVRPLQHFSLRAGCLSSRHHKNERKGVYCRITSNC